jgi:hypothetical protein
MQDISLEPNMLLSSPLQVQGLGSNNVPLHRLQRVLELLLEVFAANYLRRLRHLAEQLFQATEDTDQAAFIDVGHFAGDTLADIGRSKELCYLPDLGEGGTFAPCKRHFHQLWFEARKIHFFVHGQLTLLRHAHYRLRLRSDLAM